MPIPFLTEKSEVLVFFIANGILNLIHYFMQPADTSKVHNCIPDEHYVQTLLAVRIIFPLCLCDGEGGSIS